MGRTPTGRRGLRTAGSSVALGLTAVAIGLVCVLAAAPAAWAVINAPDIHVGTDRDRPGAVVNFTPPDTGGPTGCNWAPGSFFPIGTTTVICAPINSNGGASAALFSVVVTDTQAPRIDGAPPVTTTAAPGTGAAVVHYRVPTVHDNDPHTAASCVPASGSTFSVGTTHVTCTATDSGGNSARTGFDVTTRASAPVTAPPATAPPATPVVPHTNPQQGGFPQQPGGGQASPGANLPPGFPPGGVLYGTTTTTELATISVPPPFPTLATTTSAARRPTVAGGGPAVGGKAPTTFPRRDESVLKKRGGPSVKVAAIGSMCVLGAAIILTLLAKLRLDREPI